MISALHKAFKQGHRVQVMLIGKSIISNSKSNSAFEQYHMYVRELRSRFSFIFKFMFLDFLFCYFLFLFFILIFYSYFLFLFFCFFNIC
jgi:hypothetical protein